jgi:hypothetical protein
MPINRSGGVPAKAVIIRLVVLEVWGDALIVVGGRSGNLGGRDDYIFSVMGYSISDYNYITILGNLLC